VNIFNNKQHKN